MKNYSDQEIMQLIDQAPALVQERVGDPRTAREIAAIGRGKNLHIDQIGKVAEMTRNLLIGLVNPQEFLQELIAAGMTELVARQIMSEINQKIFIPLREEMKNASGGASGAPAAKPQIPSVAPAMPRPMPVAPSAAEPPRYFHLENKLPPQPKPGGQSPLQAPRPMQPAASQPPRPQIPAAPRPPMPETQQPAPFPQPPRPSVAPGMGGPRPTAVQPQAPKSTLAQAIANAQQRPPTPAQPSPVNILGTKPVIAPRPPAPPLPKPPESAARPAAPVIAPLPPKTVLPRPMLPRTEQPTIVRPMSAPLRPLAAPPANLPGAMSPLDANALPKPAPDISPVAPKQYSADPYREPIE